MQPHAMLQLPEVAVSIMGALCAIVCEETKAGRELQKRQIPDISGELQVTVRISEDKVLHCELYVD